MKVSKIAYIIANCSLFLDVTDPEKLDPATADQAKAVLGADLRSMDRAFLRELVDAFVAIAPQFGEQSAKLVRDIPFKFRLEEVIAADDPLRLAELEAQRNAREFRASET